MTVRFPFPRFVKRRFVREAGGSVAVEFALTAIPFFVLLFAIFEAGMVFFATSTLEQALHEAARTIRTGQAQTAGRTVQQMKSEICSEVALLSDCASKLQLDVRVFSQFSGVTTPPVTDGNGKIDTKKLAFNMGSAGDIVLIRAFYIWNIMSPFSTGLSNNGAGTRLLQSSVAFRNEPFTS